jgi:hypothetical protein
MLWGSLGITVIVTDSRLNHPVPIPGLRHSRRFYRGQAETGQSRGTPVGRRRWEFDSYAHEVLSAVEWFLFRSLAAGERYSESESGGDLRSPSQVVHSYR